MAGWEDLPLELKQPILKHLSRMLTPKSTNNIGCPVGAPLRGGPHPAAQYLSMNKTWKAILEPLVYQHLFITSSSVDGLSRLTPNQRSIVKYVWLRIDVEPNCSSGECRWYHLGRAVPAWNGYTVLDDLHRLFRHLSRWDNKNGDLTLEISIHARDDHRRLAFQNHFHFDSCPFTATGQLEVNRPPLSNCHGWCCGQRVKTYRLDTIGSLFLPFYGMSGSLKLASAPAVTKFIMRRQTRRFLQPPTLCKILDKLPNLASLQLEPWRTYYYEPDTRIYELDTGKLSPVLKNVAARHLLTMLSSLHRPPKEPPRKGSEELGLV